MRGIFSSVTLLAAFLTACGAAATPAPNGPSASPSSARPSVPSSPAPAASSSATIPVRVGAIAGTNQMYVPTLIKDRGLDKKYGLDVQIVNLSASGQQWTAIRSGDLDLNSASILDLLRQRQAGLKARTIRGYATWTNVFVATPGKPYTKLSDFKGLRVGTPSTTILDWLLLRAAGKQTANFDVQTQSQVTPSSPGLLNEQLLKNQIDVAMQFPDVSFPAEATKKLQQVTSIPAVMKDAGFDSESFYLMYNLADAWNQGHPGAAPKLIAAMNEAVAVMESDDSVWPALAKVEGVDDPSLVPAFMRFQRAAFKTTFSRDKLPPTQALFDAILKVISRDDVGATQVDPKAFDFDSNAAAQKLTPNQPFG